MHIIVFLFLSTNIFFSILFTISNQLIQGDNKLINLVKDIDSVLNLQVFF